MALIILGIIIIIIGLSLGHRNDTLKRFVKPARITGLAFIVIGVLTACVIQIDVGHVGVQ